MAVVITRKTADEIEAHLVNFQHTPMMNEKGEYAKVCKSLAELRVAIDEATD